MFNISTEELVNYFENRFEAVIVLAKEARRANFYGNDEMKEKLKKPILNAIGKLTSEGIDYTYETKSEPEQEIEEKKEKKSKKDE
ncbi:MAG: hypothetical protein E3J78_04335 [Candidatus Cloacimonadota bacterium]|nr:MAG: hypothetical protein E3J78_04335 [Candidatus Cloacimonadota bacterium]